MIGPNAQRLRLQPYRRDDMDRLAALYGDPDVTAFTKLGQLTRVQAEAALEGHLAAWCDENFGISGAFLDVGGEFVGECGLFATDGGGDLALRYALHRRFWGRGLATEAARAVIDDGFGRLGLARVLSFVEGPNDASHRVAEKLRFNVQRGGQTSKGELYTMTVEQWAMRRPPSSD